MLTALGVVRLTRQYRTGPDGGRFPADDDLGVHGYLTAGAQQLAAFAGARDSFARAQHTLRALCGWNPDDEVIRTLTHATARRAAATRDTRADDDRFTRAEDPIEVQVDAGKVNTPAGWRDVKVAVFARRPVGDPRGLSDWDQQELPGPVVRTVVAAVEEAELFRARVRAEADRLNVTGAADVTVLGDGAEWIWNLGAEVLPQGAGVLDAFHALEHVSAAVKAVWGDGTAVTASRVASGRAALLGEGKRGIEAWIGDRCRELPPGAAVDPLVDLAAYLAPHPTHLNYAARLGQGRSIGSGCGVPLWILARYWFS
ncbi:ISKra4 family transposase, partial [Gemmata sp. JC717]|uniref:ISKra4 family transposase n=1 Tax=Gemmata algarum TaxID=2975278 RepID=UPI0021BB2E7A